MASTRTGSRTPPHIYTDTLSFSISGASERAEKGFLLASALAATMKAVLHWVPLRMGSVGRITSGEIDGVFAKPLHLQLAPWMHPRQEFGHR